MQYSDITPDEIVRALLAEPSYQFQRNGEYLRKGICPGCGKRTVYVGIKHPWVLRCERLNKCGFEETTRQALPSIFADFAKRYPPTQENRDATADAYLALDRGFDLSKIRGWYEQAAYQIPNTTEYIPTVRFYIDEMRTRWWERFLGRNGKDGQKAHFGGQRKEDGTLFQGDSWAPPGQELADGERCFIVEGIFHAIALHHCGIKAVAAFSCNHFPSQIVEQHKGKGIRWVVALDSDKAGTGWAKKHHKRLKEMNELASVCLPPEGKDWDDLYRAGRIDKDSIGTWLYHGRLMLAESVEEKAYHYYVRNRRMSFIIDFGNALYSIKLESAFEKDLAVASAEHAGESEPQEQGKGKKKGQGKAQEDEERASPIEDVLNSPVGRQLFASACCIDQISNVRPQFLYMERDDIMDEQRYMFSIAYANGQADDLIAMEGSAITSPDAFHKALLNRSRGGTFDGDMRQLKILRDRWLNSRLTTVSALPFVGYDRECKAWIFQDHAWHNGRRIPLNKHGYFDIGRKGIKTVLNGVYIHTDGKFDPSWIKNFATAFHWQGMATLAFWLGSLFVQQIRAVHKTFPFLELTGEPGAGKSTILEFLWKCVGREDYEGLDLLKATVAGRRRAFSQVSNLPVVIIESDRDNGDKDTIKQKQFGFDEVKPFYNGRGTGTLGVARRSNDVDEPQFQASLLISQNAEVDGSEALLQRIVHCHADKRHHKNGTREIARWFERQTSADVGGFLGAALSQERQILEAYQQAFETLEAQYTGIKNERVLKNHAQIAACGHALKVIFGDAMTDYLTEGLTEYLLIRAKTREQRLATDHPVVEQFWETYDYLNSKMAGGAFDNDPLNHESKPGLIAINFNQYIEACRNHGQLTPDLQMLRKLLPGSNARRFVASNRCVYSKHAKKTMKCWLFHDQNAPKQED
ncbi:toprim domain-containing protein [Desulfocurvibacter africanus]|uniref:toprim domain-containing protein n=1 Tax=Desulfocurvibacter africanus TaxID=873 RepID=UPI0003FB0A5E|nr:toprim domain-containing protein [Desulfocurvibacter africanus]